MSIDIVYIVIGVLIVLVIAYFTLKKDAIKKVQSKEEKRYEILNAYSKELKEALEPLGDNKEARVAKKQELFKKFSRELSQNIFFDNSEIKEILVDLSQKY